MSRLFVRSLGCPSWQNYHLFLSNGLFNPSFSRVSRQSTFIALCGGIRTTSRSHSLSRSVLLIVGLTPLNPIPASDPLTVEFPLDVWRDSQFSRVPEAIHFSGEVFGELGRVDHQEGFDVGIRSSWGPVEGSRDHFALVDHSELVVELVTACQAWCSYTVQWNLKRLVVGSSLQFLSGKAIPSKSSTSE